ncbi:MAG: hypothetical protein OXI80_10695 [Caldilineaceae bacterium]|nr:hypothetical protein [Caldilineaceae bacterium]
MTTPLVQISFKDSGPDFANILDRVIPKFFGLLAAGVNRMWLPRAKKVTPVRTGDLRKSLRVIYSTRTKSVTVRGLYYWDFVGGGALFDQHIQMLIKALNELIPWAWNRALDEVLN